VFDRRADDRAPVFNKPADRPTTRWMIDIMASSDTAVSTNPAPSAPPRFYAEIGYVFAAVGAVLFSTKGIAIKLAYREPIDATLLLALRMALSVPIYAFVAWLALSRDRQNGRSFPRGMQVIRAALVGILGYWVASYLDFYGLEFISAQFERLILFTYPLFVVIFGALFFGQPMRLKAVAAIGLSYLGLAVIFAENIGEPGSHIAYGAAGVLLSALAFAMYQLLAKKSISELGPQLFTCIAMTGAAIAVFAQFLVTRPVAEVMSVSTNVWGISLYLAIGATVLPSFFMSAALHRISAQANSTIGTLSPVVTIILAVLVLGEPLTLSGVVGAVLVLAGVAWFTLSDRRARR
jgi:drug/metabolite transporter (DMT)-like permease